MNVLMRLTLRNLRLNKKRTVVTIIGIILSGALISGVAALVASFQDLMIRAAIHTEGAHHAEFHGVSYENVKYIRNHVQTKTAMLVKDEGFAPLEGSTNNAKPYLLVKSYDATAFEHLPVHLTEGRFPEKTGEIVLSEEVRFNSEIPIAVGDQLRLDIGRRIDGDQLLEPNVPLTPTETLDTSFSETYVITGFIERPKFEPFVSPGFGAIAFLDESTLTPDTTVNAAIIAKQPKAIYTVVPEMAETAGAAEYRYNSELLRWMGITNNSRLADMFETVGLIIIALVVIGSVTVIYNAFAISVSERKKQFGMLASVGATGKQIRKMVLAEGMMLGAVSIPVGILSGLGGIWVTLQVVNDLLAGMISDTDLSLRLVVYPETIGISVVFIALTILLSVFLPARAAARTSPIEAIRLTADIRIKGKKLRTSRLVRKLFGIEGELALKNLKRHRKRYRATVISLFISIVLYISFSSFMNYTFVGTDLYYEDIEYDMVIEKQQVPLEKKMELYRKIAAMDPVENHSVYRWFHVHARGLERSQFDEFIQTTFLDSANDNLLDVFADPDGGYRIGITITAVGDAQFQAYAEQLNIDAADYEAAGETETVKAILINRSAAIYPKLKEFAPLNVKAGERLTLTEQADSTASFTVEIGAVTETLPFAAPTPYIPDVLMVVSDSAFTHLSAIAGDEAKERADNATMFLNLREDTDRQAFAKQVQQADDSPGAYLSVQDVIAVQKQIKNIKTVVSIFLYGFVILIALIGVTNIFNTVNTNIALRRREFAMLKSVGLTPAGFNRMIRFESLFYGIKALMYGLPVSAGISFFMHNSFGYVIDFPFTPPWKEMLISTVAVFVIVYFTMMQASSRLKKENIVDALKSENL